MMTLVWILVGIIVASLIIFLLKILFIVLGIKQILGIVREEVEQLPQDYNRMRKAVKNEGSVGQPTATFAKNVFVRWFKRM
jgi:hypothetical protein